MEEIFKNYSIFNEGNILSTKVKEFIESNHYKQSAKSLKSRNIFTLYHEDLLVGCAIFGQPNSKSTQESYGSNILELRRFCVLNCAPKNTESFFLGRSLRILKKSKEISKIVSYADPEEGHIGTIYKATNFKYLGQGKGCNMTLVTKTGKKISVRQVYNKNKFGKYIKSAKGYQKMMETGEAKLIKLQSKHIYLYDLAA